MEPGSRQRGVLSFGPFRLDLDASSLSKHGLTLRLGRQPIRILAILAQRPGEVVTREEFRQDLWGADTFVDFEHGLNAAINKLRQTLGDSAERPRFIETVPGRGYRFVAAVRAEPVTPAPIQEESARDPSPVPSAPPGVEPLVFAETRRRVVPFALPMIGALVVGLGLWLAWSRRPVPPAAKPVQFKLSPPDGLALQPAAARQSFAISPDSGRLAFIAIADDSQSHLWIRDLAQLDPREVPAAKGLHTVFWSPAGDVLYFGLDRSLRRISVEPGAAPQIVTDLSRRVPPIGTWLTPERLLLSYRQLTVTVPPAGGQATALSDTYLWPQMLPDGQHLLNLVYDNKINRFRLRVSQFGVTQPVKEILETDSRVTWVESTRTPGLGYLLYVRSGSLLAQPFDAERLQVTGEAVSLASNIHVFQPTGAADFSVSKNGVLVYQPLMNRSYIAWVDRTGRELERVGPDNLSVVYVRASPDGRRVAGSVYNLERGGNEIWVYDTESRVNRAFAAGPGILDKPVWSPDGTRLVFSRGLGSGPKMYVKSLAEQEAERPLPAAGFELATDWSRDGRWLLFQGENTTDGKFGVVDLRTQRLTWLVETPANEMGPSFSPDGRWVAFISNASGRSEAYVQAFEGGERPRLIGDRTRISGDGAQILRWRADGKEICYLGMDGFLHSVPVRYGPQLQFGAPVPLFRISVASRAALPSAFGFDVTADGSRFLVPVVREPSASFMVVIQNWESLLDKH